MGALLCCERNQRKWKCPLYCTLRQPLEYKNQVRRMGALGHSRTHTSPSRCHAPTRHALLQLQAVQVCARQELVHCNPHKALPRGEVGGASKPASAVRSTGRGWAASRHTAAARVGGSWPAVQADQWQQHALPQAGYLEPLAHAAGVLLAATLLLPALPPLLALWRADVVDSHTSV